MLKAMRFGVHVTTSKGPRGTIDAAVERGCETVQIFSSNPRGWALSRVGPFDDRELADGLRAKDIGPVLLHTPYLVNLAAPDPDVYAKSVASLVHAADRARRLDGFVIVHAGRDSRGDRDDAVDRAAAAVLTALKLCPGAHVLVELTAGGRGAVAARLPEAAELLEAVGDQRAGLCLDTCHAFAAGYDLSTPTGARAFVDEADALGLLPSVRAIHLNDSRDPCGSNRDRHAVPGQGTIGEAGFRALLRDERLREIPCVLELPGDAAAHRAMLDRMRAWAGGEKPRKPRGS